MKSIFVVGCPRSGTSIAGRLLGSCRNVTYWEESNVINTLATPEPYHSQAEVDNFLKYVSMTFGIEPKDMPAPHRNLFHLALESGLTIGKEFLNFKKLRGKDLVSNILTHAWENHGKRVWVEKTPTHTFQSDLIKKLYPKSTILHICRHPFDVLASLKEWSVRRYEEWNPETACQIWNDHFSFASLKSDMSIRYKDITFHSLIIKQLADKLGLEWTKDCDELYVQVTPKTVHQWESRLTRKEIWIAYKLINWEMAERAGFLPY